MPINKKELIVNTSYAFAAQIISLLLSVLMMLFVSKVLGVESYGYWQLFIFYTSFAGFLPLGLYDGLYLKLGGKEYSKINKPLIGSLLRISIVWQIAVLLIISIAAYIWTDGERRFVILASCVMVILSNLSNFVGLMMQAVNQTKKSSIAITINKIISLILLIVLLTCDIVGVDLYIYAFIFAQFITLIYSIMISKDIFFSKNILNGHIFKLALRYTRIGMVLTIANVASLLILGVGRFFIDAEWGIEVFSIVSFALTLTHFVLLFINQLGVVFFPALRRCCTSDLRKFYYKSRRILVTYLPASFIFVYPLIGLIMLWLPKYEPSIPYFFILLPLCVYDGRMQSIGFTMLKVIRKEKMLLYFNLFSVLFVALLCLLSVFVFRSIELTVVSMLVAVIVRSILVERYLAKKFDLKYKDSLIVELVLCVIFVAGNLLVSWQIALPAFCVIYLFYYFINKKFVGDFNHQ